LAALHFKSKRERYEWMKQHNMTDDIMKFKQAFGDIKLSNVGTEAPPVAPELVNLWQGYGIKTK
jgi:hypothetical protein